MTTLTIPHEFNPRDYQLPLLKAMDKGVKRAVITWNRRSGKDKTCFNFIVKKAVERVGTYFYFLPSYTQAKKVIWDNIDNDGFKMLDHIPKELVKNSNATELKIELINGSIIQLIAADEFAKSGVGTNPIGVVFSEFSITHPDAWKYVSPILAVNGGWAIFNFTPRGKNHAWELLERAKRSDWFWEVLTVDDTKVLQGKELEEERKNNAQDFFEQEYYCKFVEGASQFFRRARENTYDPEFDLSTQGEFQLGIDLAKYQDWTVITPFNLNHFIAYPQERFNQLDWNLQKAKIEASYRRFNNAKIKIDSTGLGDPIVDDLRNRDIEIDDESSFKFTEISRTNLLNNLAILLEQDKIKIPNDEGLISELESFRYELTDRGKVKITVPEGMHDDRVMSLALSVWGIREPVRPDPMLAYNIERNRANPTTYR
jgi:hypothetical protein